MTTHHEAAQFHRQAKKIVDADRVAPDLAVRLGDEYWGGFHRLTWKEMTPDERISALAAHLAAEAAEKSRPAPQPIVVDPVTKQYVHDHVFSAIEMVIKGLVEDIREKVVLPVRARLDELETKNAEQERVIQELTNRSAAKAIPDKVTLGEEGRTLQFHYGDIVKWVTVPWPLDRGVYKAGQHHVRGDGVTYRGSFWLAQVDTKAVPGTSSEWRLAVKAGRDGQDAP